MIYHFDTIESWINIVLISFHIRSNSGGNGNCMVKIFKFSSLASLVALRVCFGLQDNSDGPIKHLFHLILHHVKFEKWPELK